MSMVEEEEQGGPQGEQGAEANRDLQGLVGRPGQGPLQKDS